MSRLGALIQQLCPDGVEYKTIGEIAVDIFRGSGIKREQITDSGTPCVRYGEIYTTYGIWFDVCVSHTDESAITSKKYFEYGDILFAITGESVEDIAKCSAYIGKDRCLAGGDIVVLRHNQDPKYLSYALSTSDSQKQKSKGKVKSKVVHSSVPAIKELVVPVPPMEVQREIVRILDQFTELTAKLTAELTAELTARKKQYEYYRDVLLTFEEGIETLPLQDCCILSRGEYITKKDSVPGNIPVILGGQEPAYYVDRYNHTGQAIVISRSGASAGFVSYWDKAIFVTDGFIVEGTTRINTRFLYHFLKNKQEILNGMKKGGGVPHITGKNIGEISIPIIPIHTQERIVSILDRFDALCNDLTSGLPAEIEARRKQYEYYRDKLLTFQEAKP